MKIRRILSCLLLLSFLPILACCRKAPAQDSEYIDEKNPGDNALPMRGLVIARDDNNLIVSKQQDNKIDAYTININATSFDEAEKVLENTIIINQYENYLLAKNEEANQLICYNIKDFKELAKIDYTPTYAIYNNRLYYLPNDGSKTLCFIQLDRSGSAKLSNYQVENLIYTQGGLYATVVSDSKTLIYPVSDQGFDQPIEYPGAADYSNMYTINNGYIYYFTGENENYQLLRKNISTAQTETLLQNILVPYIIDCTPSTVCAELLIKQGQQDMACIYTIDANNPEAKIQKIDTDADISSFTTQIYDLNGKSAISFALDTGGAKAYYDGKLIDIAQTDNVHGDEKIFSDNKAVAYNGAVITVTNLETGESYTIS